MKRRVTINMLRKFLVLFFIAVFSGPVLGASLTDGELSTLKKRRFVEHILFEQYLDTDKGVASVFGYHFDSFLDRSLYVSLAIFGAVGGNRGGYGIASFGTGFRHFLGHRLSWDSKLLIGSGGGGGIPAGGGFSIEALSGISYDLNSNLSFDIKVGYLTFPTGTFRSSVVHFGISYQAFQVYLPWNNTP
jgi:hypothetical protein